MKVWHSQQCCSSNELNYTCVLLWTLKAHFWFHQIFIEHQALFLWKYYIDWSMPHHTMWNNGHVYIGISLYGPGICIAAAMFAAQCAVDLRTTDFEGARWKYTAVNKSQKIYGVVASVNWFKQRISSMEISHHVSDKSQSKAISSPATAGKWNRITRLVTMLQWPRNT